MFLDAAPHILTQRPPMSTVKKISPVQPDFLRREEDSRIISVNQVRALGTVQ